MSQRPGWEFINNWIFSKEFQTQRGMLIERYGNFFESVHALRVHDFTYQLCKTTGWCESECLSAARIVFFHDFGKEHPRLKTYFLSPETYDDRLLRKLTRLHQDRAPEVLGRYDLGNAEKERSIIEVVASSHHKTPKDFPHGCTHEQILHMVKVVDSFDIMTCSREDNPLRGYRTKVLTIPEAALELLTCACRGVFDLRTAQLFVHQVLEQEVSL